MKIQEHEHRELERIQTFYDSVYYRTRPVLDFSRHFRRVASIVGVRSGDKVLDVACGDGVWLSICKDRGALPYGIDLSHIAIERCRMRMPDYEFSVHPAEALPFADEQFDVVSCLGALEHMVNPKQALSEIVRVAKPMAAILLLVPNAGFLARRFHLFTGTNQAAIKEEMYSLRQWAILFETANLDIQRRWKDLHVLSWAWLSYRGWGAISIRLVKAFMIALLPLKWQYQVYHLCRKSPMKML